jgi:hypothetical protein
MCDPSKTKRDWDAADADAAAMPPPPAKIYKKVWEIGELCFVRVCSFNVKIWIYDFSFVAASTH